MRRNAAMPVSTFIVDAGSNDRSGLRAYTRASPCSTVRQVLLPLIDGSSRAASSALRNRTSPTTVASASGARRGDSTGVRNRTPAPSPLPGDDVTCDNPAATPKSADVAASRAAIRCDATTPRLLIPRREQVG